MATLRPDHLDTPRPDRFGAGHRGFAEVMVRHGQAVVSGEVTYRDPRTGYSVFTAAFLAERGYCCGNGCRHCPFADA